MKKSNKSRITVKIYNRSYTIVGEENKEHIDLVANLVDEKMREIRQANQGFDTTRLAVLTAVNVMNDYVKLKEKYNTLQDSIKRDEEN